MQTRREPLCFKVLEGQAVEARLIWVPSCPGHCWAMPAVGALAPLRLQALGAAELANVAAGTQLCNPPCLFTCRAATHSILQAQAAEELANAALALSHYQAATDADEVDLDLIESLLSYISEVSGLLTARLRLLPCVL